MASINILCGRLGSSTYQDPRTTVLIWDTGAPFGLTPFKVNLLIMWSVILLWRALQKKIPSLVLEQQFISLLMQMEIYFFSPCISYHLQTTDVRLFSPQTYHQLHGAHSIIKGSNAQIVLNNHIIVIPINIQEPNIWIPNDISGFS